MTDHYTTLGVPTDATASQIKAAFRKLASEHNPDRGGDKEKSAAVNVAYACLSDPERRARYDAGGADTAPPTAAEVMAAKAQQILSKIFDHVLEDPELETNGLIRTARRELTAAGKKIANKAVDARQQGKKLERIMAKLRRKATASDLVEMMLRGRIADQQRNEAETQEAVAQMNAALALLQDYEDEIYTPSGKPSPTSQSDILASMMNAFGARS